MTLTEFLEARITEVEDRAKRAAFGWGAAWTVETDEAVEWSTVRADGKANMLVGCEDSDVTEHIARHDPASELAECEAKRKILERYILLGSRDMTGKPAEYGMYLGLRGVVLDLAAVNAGHEDYNPLWKP